MYLTPSLYNMTLSYYACIRKNELYMCVCITTPEIANSTVNVL